MGSQVKFDQGVQGFQIKENCIFSHLSMDYGREKNEICIANAKMKKYEHMLLLKSPRNKRMFLKMQNYSVVSRFRFFRAGK